jgi:hypothetical protein
MTTRLEIVQRLLKIHGPFEARLIQPPVKVRVIEADEDDGCVRVEVIGSWLGWNKNPRVRASQLRDMPKVPKKKRRLSLAAVGMLARIAASPGATFAEVRDGDKGRMLVEGFGALQTLSMRRLISVSEFKKRRAMWRCTAAGLAALNEGKGTENA